MRSKPLKHHYPLSFVNHVDQHQITLNVAVSTRMLPFTSAPKRMITVFGRQGRIVIEYERHDMLNRLHVCDPRLQQLVPITLKCFGKASV